MTRPWSPRTEGVLRRAGWQPGRSVPTATWEAVLRERGAFEAHDAARRFLAEFGGLVTHGWPADTSRKPTAIGFDPLAAEWQDERFARASREAGTPLYPVGTADEGAGLLGMSDGGALHLVRDRVELLATATDQALDRLVESQGAWSALWRPGIPGAEHPFWRRIHTVRAGGGFAGRRWSEETDRVLRAAGWFPDRSVPTETWESILFQVGGFEMHDAARRFLTDFGAVRVPYRDPWDAMPWRDFSLDPLLAFWDVEIIEDLAEQADVDLYPIGMRGRRHTHLMMAADGSVYEGMDQVWLLAPTPDRAMEHLTRQIR
ncbi:SUKH-3 domain-containing protein [Streptomyces sp. NPDC096094]|uniref:SUKH-3 domain-containing protein n=1 Tax=Streptomyces sp. NPDC096094 TaxID=3366073 RepID=UPI00382DCBB2